MKAKELIKLLQCFPEYEVGFEQYIGCDTPFLTVKSASIIHKGSKCGIYDGGECIKKDYKAMCGLINLRTYKEGER